MFSLTVNTKKSLIIISVLLFLLTMFFLVRLRVKKGIDFSCANENIESLEIQKNESILFVRNKVVESDICKQLQDLTIITPSRPNLNTEFIRVTFHFSTQHDKEVHLLKNDFHGYMIASNSSYYKNDRLYEIIDSLLN